MDYTRPTIAGSYLEHDVSVCACVRVSLERVRAGIYTGSQIAAYYRGPVDKVGLETNRAPLASS